jgi:hypothetical protein
MVNELDLALANGRRSMSTTQTGTTATSASRSSGTTARRTSARLPRRRVTAGGRACRSHYASGSPVSSSVVRPLRTIIQPTRGSATARARGPSRRILEDRLVAPELAVRRLRAPPPVPVLDPVVPSSGHVLGGPAVAATSRTSQRVTAAFACGLDPNAETLGHRLRGRFGIPQRQRQAEAVVVACQPDAGMEARHPADDRHDSLP